MSAFNEDSRVKFPTIMHLCSMGYEYVSLYGLPSYHLEKVHFDSDTNILIDYFKTAFFRLNPNLKESSFEKKLDQIKSSLGFEDLGRAFYNKILLDPGEGRIIDLSSVDNFRKNNTFQVATEMTCGDRDGDNFRPDITLFINGLPLAFIEVKKQNNSTGITAESERMKVRFQNKKFRRYLNITQIMVFSNDMEYNTNNIEPTQGAFYATIGKTTTKFNCFREDGQTSFPYSLNLTPVPEQVEEAILLDNNKPTYRSSSSYIESCKSNTPTKRMVSSLFSYERFFFLLKYGIAYVDETNGLQKHIMRYPQLFATKAIENHLEKGNNKGIIWHTQGSGKTALAYFCVKYLTDYYSKKGIIPQFYFIVDRLDLLEQATGVFQKRGLRVNTVQSKEKFKEFISGNEIIKNTEGQSEITVVNIQKFSEDSRAVSKNDYNLSIKRIYFIDEAHRNYNPKGSFLKNLLTSDPNAVKIALTGTPIISKEYNTKDIFGDYIHTYYYNASIADGYTLRLIREDIQSTFKTNMKELLERIKVKEHVLSKIDVYSHHSYVKPMLDYIMDDLKEFRIKNQDPSLAGMIVCSSSAQANQMYNLFLRHYADSSEIKLVTKEDGTEQVESVAPEVIETKTQPRAKNTFRAALILHDSFDKEERKEWIDLYRNGKIDLLIVYQMLQTGFDAPRLKKLYLNRTPKEQNLLQTLTRVNRPYKLMKYGYLVDFANIETEYSKTNRAYQKEIENEVGKENISGYSDLFIQIEEALERIRQCREVLRPYDLSNPQYFTKQIDLIDEKDTVKKVLGALEDMRDIENMLISQGSEELPEAHLPEIGNYIKAAKQRVEFLTFQTEDEDDSYAQQMLRLALENFTFKFTCVNTEELELEEQYRQSIAYTKEQFANSIDIDDPQYVSLLNEFLRIFKDGKTKPEDGLNMHERVAYLDGILARIRKLNEENRLRARKYHNDEKYARIEKRLEDKGKESGTTAFGWTKQKEQLYSILLAIKTEADDCFLHNQDILSSPFYFERLVVSIIAEKFRENGVDSDRPMRKYVGEVINKEYQKEYVE